jgi:hypothetical protein
MATRAERWKAEQERTSRPDKAPLRRTPTLADKKDRLVPEISGTVRGRDKAGTGLRNLSKGKTAAYALEDSSAVRGPSRKSTRRGAKTGVKGGTALTSRQKLINEAPAVRHARRT